MAVFHRSCDEQMVELNLRKFRMDDFQKHQLPKRNDNAVGRNRQMALSGQA